MTIYIDAIWLLNFCFDTLLLIWTTLLLKQKLRWWRVVFAGMVGSSTVFLYISPLGFLLDIFIVKIFISIVMVGINSGFKNIPNFFKTLITFYLITFVAGGLLFGLHNLIGTKTSALFNSSHSAINLYGDQITWVFLILGFPLTYLLVKSYSKTIKIVNFFAKQKISATCKIFDLKIDIIGLIDTGNQLTDPITNVPIVIISLLEFPEKIPPEITVLTNVDLSKEENLPDAWKCKVRIVPYKALGNEDGLLIAFKPDYFIINNENRNCLVSFTNQKLSSLNEYNAIIHPELAG